VCVSLYVVCPTVLDPQLIYVADVHTVEQALARDRLALRPTHTAHPNVDRLGPEHLRQQWRSGGGGGMRATVSKMARRAVERRVGSVGERGQGQGVHSGSP
jgi:hypothetical protein